VWVVGVGLAGPALAGVSAWVPLEVRDGKLIFPVEIAGVAGNAMFDTGAEGSSVSTDFVARAGLALAGPKYMVRGAGSTDHTVSSVSTLRIELFGADFKLRAVPALPHGEDLIIGVGFLKAGVLQLDYPNGRMRLATRDAVDLARVSNVAMKLEEGTALPAIEVTIDGMRRWMLFDTGNTGPIIARRALAEQGDWIARFKRAESAFTDINAAVVATDLLVLPSVKIGPYELEGVPVAIPAEGADLFLSERERLGPVQGSHIKRGVRTSGIVGYEVLRHFVVTVDYERQEMHVAAPPPSEGSGSAPAE
jgi:hypothetical protein